MKALLRKPLVLILVIALVGTALVRMLDGL